jgi:arylsulfatase A-like enzyme
MANRPTRREAIAGLATAAALAGTKLALGEGAYAGPATARPNIVFILADDLGYADVSCYGRKEYKTAHIDRLAAEGMRFLQAYANSAICSATRTALITGRYQYRLPVGLFEPLPGPGATGLPPSHPTLPSLLRKAGYGTTLIGKWHLGWLPESGPLQSGYDHFYGYRGGAVDYFTHKAGVGAAAPDDLWDQDVPVHQAGYLTQLLGDRAVAAIHDYAQSRQPFLLSFHSSAPHWPWEGPGDEAESQRLGRDRSSLRDYDGGNMATYAQMVMSLDAQVGRVLEALETGGIANNTIVIFTSDNGGERFADTWPFTGKKGELLEGGLRIPALLRWPGHVRPGSESQQVMISMDWLPTLLAAAGVEQDPAFPSDGMSLLPALQSPAPTPVSRKLFWRFQANHQSAMRSGDMKMLTIRENTFLFNVVDDPLERANLARRQPETLARMQQEYLAWNATMLPENPEAYSEKIYGWEWADHYGVEPDR